MTISRRISPVGAGPTFHKHTLQTRLLHAGLATTVILQLGSGLVMRGPRAGHPGDWMFEFHQYCGLTSFSLAFGFFLVVALRRTVTEPGLLFPWFDARRLAALWKDMELHAQAVRAMRVPRCDGHAPLASAVHGLGLLLLTAMAATGTVFSIASLLGEQNDAFVRVAFGMHHAMANLVWAYLIGHAGLAVLHHYLRDLRLGEMWSPGTCNFIERQQP